jgi:hypothetical protein
VEWWSAGVVECWSAGVLECWSAGAVECWSGGVLEWGYRALAQGFNRLKPWELPFLNGAP